MEQHLAQIRKEGYFQTAPIVDSSEVDKLRRCATTVLSHGYDPAYALVYDEFYHVMAKLTNVLARFWGPIFSSYRTNPGVLHPHQRSGDRPHPSP